VDQVFKRDGVTMTVSFAATLSANQADYSRQAQRGLMEADSNNLNSDFNATGTAVSARQEFILTGSNGSRLFNFDSGTALGTIVDSIQNVKESTGVGATLIFGSDVVPDEMLTNANYGAVRTAGMVEVYGADLNDVAANRDIDSISFVTAAGAMNTFLRVGKNLDGQGRVYAEVTGRNGNLTSYDLYKDEARTMLLGSGTHDDGTATFSFSPVNNSGIPADSLRIEFNVGANGAQVGKVYTIAMLGMEMNAATGIDTSGMSITGLDLSGTGNPEDSVLAGIELGKNTSRNGELFFQATGASNARTIKIFTSADMRDDQLVAEGTANLSGGGMIRVEAANSSGLNVSLNFTASAADNVDESGQINFTDLGVRLYSLDYGSQETVRLQNNAGTFFQYYRLGDNVQPTLIEETATAQVSGQDAQISLNGAPLGTQGLTANVTTPDFSGALTFNQGELGLTTIATVGYDVGALFSRATALQSIVEDDTTLTMGQIYTFATNARHSTTEDLTNFIGGMQYQLGAGEGDQERTVYSIQSMASVNIGRIEVDGEVYTLQDVLAGGRASLANDPIMALRVVTQAVNDVSDLRARLGAFQKNMLQTNINSLNVAVENIVKTESAIRDANMAAETTEFTKNQILLQAGTAMLAQANTASQNILQLLG